MMSCTSLVTANREAALLFRQDLSDGHLTSLSVEWQLYFKSQTHKYREMLILIISWHGNISSIPTHPKTNINALFPTPITNWILTNLNAVKGDLYFWNQEGLQSSERCFWKSSINILAQESQNSGFHYIAECQKMCSIHKRKSKKFV